MKTTFVLNCDPKFPPLEFELVKRSPDDSKLSRIHSFDICEITIKGGKFEKPRKGNFITVPRTWTDQQVLEAAGETWQHQGYPTDSVIGAILDMRIK